MPQKDIFAQNLAMEIKVARIRASLTQKQLAERVFVSPDKISRFELGVTVPDFLTLCAIAQATNYTFADFGIGAEGRSSGKN